MTTPIANGTRIPSSFEAQMGWWLCHWLRGPTPNKMTNDCICNVSADSILLSNTKWNNSFEMIQVDQIQNIKSVGPLQELILFLCHVEPKVRVRFPHLKQTVEKMVFLAIHPQSLLGLLFFNLWTFPGPYFGGTSSDLHICLAIFLPSCGKPLKNCTRVKWQRIVMVHCHDHICWYFFDLGSSGAPHILFLHYKASHLCNF